MSVVINRQSPQADNPNSGPPSRAGRYSEAYNLPVSNKEFWAADEGSYFVTNTALGTPVIGPVDAADTPTATKGLMSIYNSGSNKIYPQFLRLYVTTVGVTGTRANYSFGLDPLTNRYVSGGTALVSKNVNSASTNTSGASIVFGALTLAAAGTNYRQLPKYQPRGTIEVVEDCYEFNFGGHGGGTISSSRVATVAEISMTVHPIVLGPGDCLILQQYRASIGTGITFEAVLGYIER